MRQQNFWFRALNIRPDEGWLVKKLFLLQFFQGAGIAFFFTAGFALFLAKFPVTELPYVFIIASVLLWVVGFIYSKIEHLFDIGKLSIIITVFMIASMVAFRLAFAIITADWFLYWMLAWFNVLYLLNNLEFWGVASLSFDVRQSKRLFGIISAGDIPAKFIGYSLALLMVSFIGTINLLWIGIFCMLASIPYLISIRKSGKLVDVQHHKHTPAKHSPESISKIIKKFSENILIRRLSVLSIIITASFIIINYEFYAAVKEAYNDDVSLAKFIAFFLAIVRIIALIVKVIFTGRLINKLGIVKSLLITPVALFVLILTIIFIQNIPGNYKATLYLFGATYIVVDILRSAINSPVFLTIMQPLSNHERLKAHTILKGIMDPFASLASGILILLLLKYQHEVKLLTLTYILLTMCIFWIIGIYRVNSEYLKIIIKSLSSRYFIGEHFSVNDSGTLEWLKQKTKDGTEIEVINILNMLYDSKNEMSGDLLIDILQHPSEKVKLATLRLIQEKKIPAVENFLLPFLQNNDNPALLAACIKIMCRNMADSEIILPYLEHTHPEVRKAALGGLYFYESANIKEKATSILRQMTTSAEITERLIVAEILSKQENPAHLEMILQLINDSDTTVRKVGFLAAGKSGDGLLIQELMNRIKTDEAAIVEALFVAGDASLPFILNYIKSEQASPLQREKLILLCGRKGGDQSQKILLSLLSSIPAESTAIIKALYRSNYVPKPADQLLLTGIVNKLLNHSAGIIYMQGSLEPMDTKYQLLINSFRLELHSLRESILYLFALLYDREHINKVRTAYATGKKSSIINAMEIIDIAVRKDLAVSFNTIFEPGDITERMHGLRKIYPLEFFENVEKILTRILAEQTRPYSQWTLACSLYTSKKQQHTIDQSLIEKYTLAENLLLKETAFYAL